MEKDVAVGRVDIMSVAMPRGRMQVDFHIAGSWEVIRELDQRVTKIGTGLVVPETGMQDTDRSTIAHEELVAAQALMKPDCLEEPFRGRAVRGFPEHERAQGPSAPLRVRD